MVVMNLKLDGIYGFNDFEINFSYPKKVVHSIIEDEYLEGRQRFRYKKIVVLMGANATGKTAIGKSLLKIFNFINTGNSNCLFEMLSDNSGSFEIDFVNNGYRLHRLICHIDKVKSSYYVEYFSCEIDKMDSYEMCVDKLIDYTDVYSEDNKIMGQINYRFAYPEIESSIKLEDIDRKLFGKTLRAILKTLDPTLLEICESKDLKDTYIVRKNRQEIIIQEGKLLNKDILSSGTAEGIDVALFLASMMSKKETFYYCDEHFSYIQSDIEKRIFGLMLDRVSNNEQLIFTTHNTDMLDLNLPKHSFMFLKKGGKDENYKVSALSASDILKRNTDSVRCAYENDMFDSLPDETALDELEI